MTRNKYLFYLCFLLNFVISAGSQPYSLEYGLRPGLDLTFTTQMELSIEGPYAERSTRTIESRFIVLDRAESGRWPMLGVSRLTQRILEGQEVEVPFRQRQLYRFAMSEKGDYWAEDTEKAEFGTGWTPMLHFPPLPKETLSPDIRTQVPLPIDIGLHGQVRGTFSILVRPLKEDKNGILIGAGLLQSLGLQQNPPLTVLYQEHEIRFDRRQKLPSHTQSSTQIRMESDIGVLNVDSIVESRLQKTNIYRAEDLPAVRAEVSEFFLLTERLKKSAMENEDDNLNRLIVFSERSPIGFLREAAKDFVQIHRHNMRLEENRRLSDPSSVAPEFSGESVQGNLIRFPSAKREPAVLVFWALWWEPAERALWEMEELRKVYEKKNVRFIGINLDSTRKIAADYVKQGAIAMPVIWDESYPKAGIAFKYGIRNIPTIVVADKKGKVVARDLSGEGLTALLNKIAK